MVDRIKKIAENWQLSPTAFADRIEVPRPVISHVFSERNRPSLEVVQKIGIAFPEVDSDWLLFGTGQMLRQIVKEPASLASKPEPEPEGLKNPVAPKVEKKIENKPESSPAPPAIPPGNNDKRQVKKVMVFYSDQTVEIFDPQA